MSYCSNIPPYKILVIMEIMNNINSGTVLQDLSINYRNRENQLQWENVFLKLWNKLFKNLNLRIFLATTLTSKTDFLDCSMNSHLFQIVKVGLPTWKLFAYIVLRSLMEDKMAFLTVPPPVIPAMAVGQILHLTKLKSKTHIFTLISQFNRRWWFCSIPLVIIILHFNTYFA